MPTDSDLFLKDILQRSKTIALVGASNKPTRASYRVMGFLLSCGYNVYPVNPLLARQTIHDQTVYASLSDIPHAIDMVDIFRRSEETSPIIDEAITIGAKAIWMQLGVINEQGADKARSAGLNVVMDRCPAIEIPRLGL